MWWTVIIGGGGAVHLGPALAAAVYFCSGGETCRRMKNAIQTVIGGLAWRDGFGGFGFFGAAFPGKE